MTVQQQIIQEIQDLPQESQIKVLKLVHFVKEELFPLQRPQVKTKRMNVLADIDDIAIETGIPDLATQHDLSLWDFKEVKNIVLE